jgi:hypothetical protein
VTHLSTLSCTILPSLFPSLLLLAMVSRVERLIAEPKGKVEYRTGEATLLAVLHVMWQTP